MSRDFSIIMVWVRRAFFLSAVVFLVVLSVRKLSDPDLGFHLFYGKWVTENLAVPAHDLTTYSAADHTYTDMHWLFQVVIYNFYRITGYTGLSILTSLLFMLFLALAMARNRSSGISAGISMFLILLTAILSESRAVLRPEMFTFIFLVSDLLILDIYRKKRKSNLVYLLPVIQLLWCNMHGLFILGLFTMTVYFLSSLRRDKHLDRNLLALIGLSALLSLANPYFLEGFLFPFTLLTRFGPSNIFHQHIAEFRPLFSGGAMTPEQVLFVIYVVATLFLFLLTFRQRRLHEWLLTGTMLVLAISAVRNIPLFVIVSLPVAGSAIMELLKGNSPVATGFIRLSKKRVFMIVPGLLITLVVALATRDVVSGRYYTRNRENIRFGLGLDRSQLPEGAAGFLLKQGLDGRVLNSLGAGGWLSWRLPQPVFIDGRLEVMQEGLYKELSASWEGGLPALVQKYKPALIVFNYLKYYPWTAQIKAMHDWKLIYLDGLFVVFAYDSSTPQIPGLTDMEMIKQVSAGNPDGRSLQNAGMFCLQMDRFKAASELLSQSLKYSGTDPILVKSALKQANQMPGRKMETAINGMQHNSPSNQALSPVNHAEASLMYNEGNRLYQAGDQQAAIRSFSEAIRIDPAYAKAYNNRGNILALQGKYQEALADFEAALRFNPAFADAWLGKGSCCYFLGNKTAAMQAWGKAKSLGNKQADQMIRQARSK